MDPERRRQLAQRGGRRAHELGKAHVFSGDEAIAAGKKGGAGLRARFRSEQAARERDTPVDREVRARIYDERKAAGSCTKCGVVGPEHKMCRGNS
jgi:hypothetical protein